MPIAYKDPKHAVHHWRDLIEAEVTRVCAKKKIKEPLEGPLGLDLLFFMPRPDTIKWKRRVWVRLFHGKKPDCDNLAKAVKDTMSGIAYVDDRMVCDLRVRKIIAADEACGVLITLRTLTESDLPTEPGFAPTENAIGQRLTDAPF